MSTREQGVRRIAAVTGGLVAASVAGTLAVAAAAHAADRAAAGGPSGEDSADVTGNLSGGAPPGGDDWSNGFSQQGQQPVLPGGGFGPGHAASGGS
jgi:hypothetical protein